MYVKICGTTSAEDAALAVEAGADAVGFIFAPSPRRVTPVRAAEMPTPGHVQRVGIFVDATYDEMAEATEVAGLHAVQMHGGHAGEAERTVVERLRGRLRAGADRPALIGVLHVDAGAPGEAFVRALEEAAGVYDAVLLDHRTAMKLGGTGMAFDWRAAREALERAELALPKLIVAGGLHPGNVAEAIGLLRPWGVDVVSGVEAAPGRKDATRLRGFVAAVRRLEG